MAGSDKRVSVGVDLDLGLGGVVGAVVVYPGDKIVLTFPFELTIDKCHKLRDAMEEQLPGVEVVILDNVGSALVVRHPYRVYPEVR
jgi:hypothetical protein